jgi:hypothetical protein
MHMKLRMTLTIEPEISHRAKAFARSRGTSLSGLVESLLSREAGIESSEKKISFGKKWAGRLQIKAKNEARFTSLKERYGL